MKKCALGIMVFLVCFILTMGLSAAQDLIYVVERGSGELSVVDEGGLITLLTSGLEDPLDVEILPNGNLLVSERGNDTSSATGYLTEIDLDGVIISRVILSPQFSPNDIFIDDDGTIYVTSLSGIWKKGPSVFSKFSTVPGDLTDMVRLGDFFYVTNVAGGNALYRINQITGAWTLILSGFSNPLGLAVIGEDLLVAEWGANRIRRVTNLASGFPTISPFAGNLPRASSFTVDDEGNFILSHQKTPGSISKVSALGVVTPFVTDNPLLNNPRGLVFSSGVIEVAIDIKPGSYPNCFNSNGHGVIPVAILGSEDFDVSIIDPASVMLDGQEVRVKGKSGNAGSLEDVNDDGFDDLVVQILDNDFYDIPGTTTGIITATSYDGMTSFKGEDSICITQD